MRAVIEVCVESGVEVLTLFAFSSENWQRPADEVSALMELFLTALRREARKLSQNGIRLRIIGDRSRFHPELQAAMAEAEALASEGRFLLQVAANYGGQWDITQAARQLAERVQAGELRAEQIDAAMLEGCLATAGQPLPDLCIRTGGEHRISNFLLWQLAYSELYFSDLYWPDFKHEPCARRWPISPPGSDVSARPETRWLGTLADVETTHYHRPDPAAGCAGGFLPAGRPVVRSVHRRRHHPWCLGVGAAGWPAGPEAAYRLRAGRGDPGELAVPLSAAGGAGAGAGDALVVGRDLAVLRYPASAEAWRAQPVQLLIGLLILLPAFQGLLLLKQWPLGNWLIVAVMVLVWVADIGAYFSGRAFGKRKLAPKVSPGKSWEGVFGGLLASLLVTLGVGLYRDWLPSELLLAMLGALWWC